MASVVALQKPVCGELAPLPAITDPDWLRLMREVRLAPKGQKRAAEKRLADWLKSRMAADVALDRATSEAVAEPYWRRG